MFVSSLLVTIAVAVLTVSAAFAQDAPCAPCPDGALCIVPECPPANIRIWNNSPHDMEQVLVNFPSQEEDFGDIPSGGYSDFRPIDMAYSYAGINLVIDGEPASLIPIDYVGETPLEGGFYTYMLKYDLEWDRLDLTFAEVVATVEFTGGMCVYGGCHTIYTLNADGTLTLVQGSGDQLTTTLHVDDVAQLTRAIESADFEVIRSQPFTGTCPIAYDGQEVIYTFYTDTVMERIASCEYEIDPSLPLFQITNTILESQSTSE